MIKRFEEFTKNVAIASKCISKIKAYEMKQFGLRSGNVMCLFFLGQSEGGLTAHELGEKCGEDKAGISRSLALLTERGYIKAEDGRKYKSKFRITDEGRKVCNELNIIIRDVVECIGRDLTVLERATFYSAFSYITSNLTEFCEELEKKETNE